MKTDRELMGRMGAYLKTCRERVSLTQGEAARIAVVQRSTISNWEAGRNLPSMLQARRLAVAYECSGHEFYFGRPFFSLTKGQRSELARRIVTFPDDLQRAMEHLLSVAGTSEFVRVPEQDFEPSIP